MDVFCRFLVALFGGCLTAVTVYCVAYDVTYTTIVYHLALIGTGVIALLAVGFLLLRINDKSRALTLVYALSWSVFTGLIVVGYGLTFLGEAMLSIPLPFSIFRAYAGQFTRMIHAYGLSPWVVGGAAGPVARQYHSLLYLLSYGMVAGYAAGVGQCQPRRAVFAEALAGRFSGTLG